MDLKDICSKIQYEEYLKKIYELYPRLGEKSRTAIMVKAIEKLGPCTWKTIQAEAFKDKCEMEGLTIKEWQDKHGNGYGIDVFNRAAANFTESYRDPSDRRKILYKLNTFGKAFIYCYDNLYAKTKSKDNPVFLKILKNYGKTLKDIDRIVISNDEYYWVNREKHITPNNPMSKTDMRDFVRDYKYAQNNQEDSFIDYCDDTLTVTRTYNNTIKSTNRMSIIFK